MNKLKITVTSIVLSVLLAVMFSCTSTDTVTTANNKTTAPVTTSQATVSTSNITTKAPITVAPITVAPITEDPRYSYLDDYESVLPKPSKQPTTITFISKPKSDGENLAAVTFEGLLAKHSHDELMAINTGNTMKTFLNIGKKNYGVTVRESSLWLTIKRILADVDFVKGYIITDMGDDSVNVATSLASMLDAIVITKDFESKVQYYGLECLLDVTDWTDATLRKSEYMSKLSKKVGFICNTNNSLFLRDYAVMCGSYCYSDATTQKTDIVNAFDFMDDNFVIFGWNNNCGEYGTVEAISTINGCLIPADYAANLAALSSFRLSSATQITEEIETDGKGKHTVLFLISDGDNLQWTLNDYSSSDKWYGSSKRGNFYLGWGLPASLIDVAPTCLQHFYNNMTAKDQFVLELSGTGYTFPAKWRSSNALKEMYNDVASAMKRSGMSYIEILDTCSFSESTVNRYYSDLCALDDVKGVFFINYSNYAQGKGKIYWCNDTPVVSARYKLWADNTNTPEFIAEKINTATTDPTLATSYSVVSVHVWSGLTKDGKFVANGNTIDGIEATINLFDGDVEVVTPDEFMQRIIENKIGQ